jgi:hypothetical protein
MIEFMKTTYTYIRDASVSFRLSNRMLHCDDASANIEFMFSLLIEPNDLYCRWNHLQEITLIRPIIDSMICLPDIFLQSFFIYSSVRQIILKKTISYRRIPILTICYWKTLRSLLDNNGGMYEEIMSDFQNSNLSSIIFKVEHLKLFIDDYSTQQASFSTLIRDNLLELTVSIQDEQFQEFDGHLFSRLFVNLSDHCQLRFFMHVHFRRIMTDRDINVLLESYNTSFYKKYQSNVQLRKYRPSCQRNIDSSKIFTLSSCTFRSNIMHIDDAISSLVRRQRFSLSNLCSCVNQHVILTVHHRKLSSCINEHTNFHFSH